MRLDVAISQKLSSSHCDLPGAAYNRVALAVVIDAVFLHIKFRRIGYFEWREHGVLRVDYLLGIHFLEVDAVVAWLEAVGEIEVREEELRILIRKIQLISKRSRFNIVVAHLTL